MMRLICITFIIGFLYSCEKKEIPVQKYDRGDILTTQIDMNSDYKRQVWYSLHDNKTVSVNLKTDWDLAFEASSAGFHVLLNGAKAMKIYKTNYSALSEVNDTSGLGSNSKADMPTGNFDSTAIGNWQADGKVYVINRGYNESGILQGFYKLKLSNVTATQFTFDYGDIYSTEIFHGVVNKDDAYNFIMFSLSGHAQVSIEPKKQDYDLCFTQYTHLFTNPFQYYQVTGVLSNNFNTTVALIKDKAFTDITISDTLNRFFDPARNAIGYDWKSFDLTTNLYTVNPAWCYVVHDNKGFCYKLHFIDFLSASGEKGFPKFEFKKL